MKDENRAALTLTVVYAFVGAFFWAASLWPTATADLCNAEIFVNAPHQGTWCFDFWLNRYQTLLGALAAIFAATAAWIIGMRQLRRSDEGLEIARRQTAANALPHIASRLALFDRAIGATRLSEESIAGIRNSDGTPVPDRTRCRQDLDRSLRNRI